MHILHRFILIATLMFLGLGLTATASETQTYPTRPVRVVVPFPAGGIVDVVTRAVTEKVASNWGQPIIVDAKPGAGSLVGTENVAHAPADGYTFLAITIAAAVGPLINPQFKYDMRKDFVPVIMFATAPNLLVVPSSLPVSSMEEFTELVKKNPHKFNYAHTGAGTTNHLPVESLKHSRKLSVSAVAYRGQPQAITDLLTGQIQLFVGAPALLVPHVKTGKLKAIATTSAVRLEEMPNVPTLSEAGFSDVLGGSGWFGIVAPIGTPPEFIHRFNTEINTALKSPEVIERLRKIYAFAEGGSSAEFTEFLTHENVRWSTLVKDAQIKME